MNAISKITADNSDYDYENSFHHRNIILITKFVSSDSH